MDVPIQLIITINGPIPPAIEAAILALLNADSEVASIASPHPAVPGDIANRTGLNDHPILSRLWLTDDVLNRLSTEAGVDRAAAKRAAGAIARFVFVHRNDYEQSYGGTLPNQPDEFAQVRVGGGYSDLYINAADFVRIMELPGLYEFILLNSRNFGPKLSAAAIKLAEHLKEKHNSLPTLVNPAILAESLRGLRFFWTLRICLLPCRRL